MAAFRVSTLFVGAKHGRQFLHSCVVSRNVSTTSRVLAKQEQQPPDAGQAPESKGWFKKIMKVGTGEPGRASHSSQLSAKETVYEMQFHAVKPEAMEEYLNKYAKFQQLMHDKQTGAKLVGSFTVEIGDQDEAIHIWEYNGGYPVLNNATIIYRTDKDIIQYRRERNKMLRSRRNQILLAFGFWPEIQPREGKNIYELRSYTLKPGTMIEWANSWSRGIESRRENNEPVAGFFSQIGVLYEVQHIWGYKDLQTRLDTREAAWQKPGWDECVAYTVPLIRYMQSRILIPTPFSPLQ
ncbi:hypothetical protein ACJMK2_012706 [Sinanodonta woodiana]|uniref:NIPSNAP domain-containing protein n=1 Tax=Sinanodonta woodiana TaxID=1069815 RepID=A0ABD3V937_SINWO